MLKNKVIFSLTKTTAASIHNELNLCGGDFQGKVEVVCLRHLSHMKVESIILEYHNTPIELTRLCRKDVLSSGFWIITFSKGCFALWDSTAHITPLNVVYCNIADINCIVFSDYHRNWLRSMKIAWI